MKYHFKRTFDCLKLSDESQERICTMLTAHMKDSANMPSRPKRHPKRLRILLAAAAALLAVTLTGFAFGEQIFPLLGGGRIIRSVNEEGEDSVSVDTGFAVDPVVIWDGQIFFTLDDSYTNITEQCSDTTYYQYESSDADGSQHIVLIGGSPEHVGWAEFTILPDGTFFSNATYDSGEEPAWLTEGRAAVKEQYGIVLT